MEKSDTRMDPEKLVHVESFLEKHQYNFRFVYSQPDFIELLNKEATKGNALTQLSKLFEIETKSIVAIGDNMNDLEMIQVAGLGIAVSNAHVNLIANADYTCGHHNEDAVADVIELLEKDSFKEYLDCGNIIRER